MDRCVWLLLVALTLFPVRCEAATRRLTAAFTSTSLVLVPVHVNSRGPYYFVIDTGATTTTLDDRLATELRIQPTGTLEIVTSGGTFGAPVGRVDELAIDTLRMTSLEVSWMPLDELRRDDRRIMGVIGQDVLSKTTVVIDYARRRVALTPEPCGGNDAMIDVAWAGGRPMIDAGVHGRGLPSSAKLVLDSASNALLLFARADATGQITKVSTHRNTVTADVLPRVTVDVAGARRAGPAVLLPPAAARTESGLLPTAWYSVVCIDGPRQRATLR